MGRPVLRTALCELLGIEYPVLLAGMGPVAGGLEPVATSRLVAAVSEAGGLGVIGGVAYSPEELRREIQAVRRLTDRPFGVDLLFAQSFQRPVPEEASLEPDPAFLPGDAEAGLRRIAAELGISWRRAPVASPRPTPPPGKSWVGAQVEVVLEERVPVLASGLGDPGPWVERLRANGTRTLALVGNVRAARRVAASDVDVVVAQGTEAGGHTGRIGTLALLPQVLDAVAPVPVVAAGGVGDGRGLAAVLAAGAVGAWCGTAFLVADEANQPELQKDRILAAAAEDTIVTRLYSGKTMRNIRNPLIEAWESSGLKAMPMGLQGLVMRDLLYSIRCAGREDLLMNAAGQISGMLEQRRPAREILDEMVAEAADIFARRLPAKVVAEV